MPSSTVRSSSRWLTLNGGSASTSVASRRPSSACGRSSSNWSATDGATAVATPAMTTTAAIMAPAAASASGTRWSFIQRTAGSRSVLASSAMMIGSTTTRR